MSDFDSLLETLHNYFLSRAETDKRPKSKSLQQEELEEKELLETKFNDYLDNRIKHIINELSLNK